MIDSLKPKPINSPRVNDPSYRGMQWGLLSWGHDEFTSWFGVSLPQVYWPGFLARRFEFFDNHPPVQEGFYGILHAHS
ncbi:hypothetical protein [Streptomyces hydrogenans]|uniref:Uncharacterized protein n=1 Tax=Streptomyces hydrogenans TaxID=1873719 RepID=A0ABQ3PJD2_9ACTN|nr:hypothetical protein [Streptomyces hydrogenans]GHF94450.1 hypothetical protein GCM10018784_02650 [Streptomyces hydrogenans]GHI25139.1 hypothetical protein Shyd_65100 [Streptomyces hydrogenans]